MCQQAFALPGNPLTTCSDLCAHTHTQEWEKRALGLKPSRSQHLEQSWQLAWVT